MANFHGICVTIMRQEVTLFVHISLSAASSTGKTVTRISYLEARMTASVQCRPKFCEMVRILNFFSFLGDILIARG
jgi:hypothetical protein